MQLLGELLLLMSACTSVIQEVQGLSLSSSPPSEDGIISVCPATNVTLTCSASDQTFLAWRQVTQLHTFFAGDYETEETRSVQRGSYTLTLVSVDNVSGSFGDFTSTLEAMVDDIISNTTTITCELFTDEDHLTVIKIGAPTPPSRVSVVFSYQRGNFSITLSWESGEDEVVDEYRIHTNTTPQYLTTTSRYVALEAKYNIPLEIRVSAINCAGSSPEVTQEVFVSGCGPPCPPVNGSVGEFTSSRVGDQVVYSCDTHLVLVGETTATCSYPSLQWLPPSENVTCLEPSADTVTPSNPPTSAAVIAGVVLVSVFGPVCVIFITLVVLYKHRFKTWKLSRVVEDNCYDGQEMLMRPGSSTGTLSVSTALSPTPHSPLAPPSHDLASGPTVPYYSDVNRTTEAPSNGTSSTVVYSETSISMRSVVASEGTQGVVTSHQSTTQPTEYSTEGNREITSTQAEKYAQLAFENSGNRMPSLEALEQPVQYSKVNTSTKTHPQRDPHEPCDQSAVDDPRHPLDQRITIDMAIQQLQQLTPHWWAVGEAAGLEKDKLKEVLSHYQGGEKESFVEVMNHIFQPGHTTWTILAGVCERAGFTDLATALLDSYTTGVLPVVIDEDEDTLRPPPSKPAPPLPPRGSSQDEDTPPSLPPPLSPRDIPPSLPPPLSPEDIPPSLPPPLAPEDIPPSLPPPLAPDDIPVSVPSPPPPTSAEVPPPRPPKSSKPPALPPRH